jgi:DNA polymerase
MQEKQTIHLQERLLRSLGFGFVELPCPDLGNLDQPSPPVKSPARRSTQPQEAIVAPRIVSPGPFTTAPLPPDERAIALGALAEEIRKCTNCQFHLMRKTSITGAGNVQPRVLFITEGPSAEEDAEGKIGSGPAGELLKKMVAAMKLSDEEFYVTAANKCHSRRAAHGEEIRACSPFLERQIDLLRPEVIVAMGANSLIALMPSAERNAARMRGEFLAYRGIPVMATFDPSYIMLSKDRKRLAWEDLKKVMLKLGIQP